MVAVAIVIVVSLLSILEEEDNDDVAFSLDFMTRTAMVVVKPDWGSLVKHAFNYFVLFCGCAAIFTCIVREGKTLR